MDPVKNTHRISLKLIDTPPSFLTFQAFLLDKEATNLSPRTLEFYEQKLTPFLEFLGKRGVAEVDDNQLDRRQSLPGVSQASRAVARRYPRLLSGRKGVLPLAVCRRRD